jgi:hypothetical protein
MANSKADDSDPLGPSKEDIEEFKRESEELETELREMQARLEPFAERRLRDLAGRHLETMLSSKEETLKYLTHADPKLREAALQLAYRRWEMADMLATVYEKMALSDPSDDVRDTAIRALGTCYARTKDQRIGRLLAGLARNPSLSDAIRMTAFTSLLRLHGNMDYTGKSPLVAQSLEDIDWGFVDQYYTARLA